MAELLNLCRDQLVKIGGDPTFYSFGDVKYAHSILVQVIDCDR